MPRLDSARFDRYVGIDYSGAATADARLAGLRVYVAERGRDPVEIRPSAAPRRHWTRRGLADRLVEMLSDSDRALVGIDHGLGFPLRYFEAHGLPADWSHFLDDFRRHWPTDEEDVYVDFVRDGVCGNGAARQGNARWRRLTEQRAGAAKSVFHFDVPGSVAKSTHAGLPWLFHIRRRLAGGLHCWPFDGWDPAPGRSVIAEVYPALWHHGHAREDRSADQHDAWVVARWLQQADLEGRLERFLEPPLSAEERAVAAIEGWILGVM
jgi:hypothetical protein